MRSSSLRSWYTAFRADLRSSPVADQLRAAADGARLGPWTVLLTGMVVETSTSAMGWKCGAKGAGHRPLPVERQEYLGIDVLAFEPGSGWRPPVAAFELENSPRDGLVAYALWKACTIQTGMAAMFCYRRVSADVGPLVAALQDDVLCRLQPDRDILVVVGTRASADTFPDGYFRPFEWNRERGVLTALTGGSGTGRGDARGG